MRAAQESGFCRLLGTVCCALVAVLLFPFSLRCAGCCLSAVLLDFLVLLLFVLRPMEGALHIGAHKHQLHLLVGAREEACLVVVALGATNGTSALQRRIQRRVATDVQIGTAGRAQHSSTAQQRAQAGAATSQRANEQSELISITEQSSSSSSLSSLAALSWLIAVRAAAAARVCACELRT